MPLRIILLEPEKAGNIGGVARSMKNFGQRNLWIVNPKTDITGEARAYAMHGADVLSSAKIVNELDEALKTIDIVAGTTSVVARSTSNLTRTPITPREFSERVIPARGNVAIIFGRESSGLNNEEIERCDLIITIPASQEYNVLNLSTAVSIILYELFQKTRRASDQRITTRFAKQQLLAQFDELVSLSGIQTHKRKLARRAFRNLISRSFISMRETSLLIGVFRRSNLKIRVDTNSRVIRTIPLSRTKETTRKN
ncbi:MAG TPA: RNA methyltransferase [Candidatus Bathyarchaeia archaeon]|nr:RNA methyltransferase [Candidatus Bathyarchaeia archaeon]